MNLNFEYVTDIEVIQSNNLTIICKFCKMPLVRPILCTNCYEYMCHFCPSLSASNRCCETNCIVNLNNTDDTFNGKGVISKMLEQLEIYCAVNKENGCEWIGKRGDYLDHYHACIDSYKLCDFGCGMTINIDDAEHFNHCDNYNQWLKIKPLESDIDNKYLCYMKHTQKEIHDLKLEINKLKNNTLSAHYIGTIDASENTSQITLAEIILPNEDAMWMISIYLSYESTIPNINVCSDNSSIIHHLCDKYELKPNDRFISNWDAELQKHLENKVSQEMNIGNYVDLKRNIRRESVMHIYKKYNLKFNENFMYMDMDNWKIGISSYVHIKSVEHINESIKNKYNLILENALDYNNEINKYVERKSIEFACDKYDMKPVDNFIVDWCHNLHQWVGKRTIERIRHKYYPELAMDKVTYETIQNKYVIDRIITAVCQKYKLDKNIEWKKIVYYKGRTFCLDINFLNDNNLSNINPDNFRIDVRIFEKEAIDLFNKVHNYNRSEIINDVNNAKKIFYDNLHEEIDGPRKKFYDDLHKKINDEQQSYHQELGIKLNAIEQKYLINLKNEINNEKNKLIDDFNKHVVIQFNKSIQIANNKIPFESKKYEPEFIHTTKNSSVESRTIKFIIEPNKTGLDGSIYAEHLDINHGVIVAQRIGNF